MTTDKAGRPRWWTAGLVGFLCLVLGVVAWLALRDGSYVAAPPAATHASARPDLAATALEDLRRAVAGRDTGAAERVGADARARTLLGAVVANAVALDVADFTARYVDESGAVDAHGSWTAAVDLTWRFGRADPSAVHEEVPFSFVASAGGVRISAIGGTGHRSPLWLTGPVHVRTDGSILVLGAEETAVRRYARLATRAVRVVRRVVTGPRSPLVVEIPPSQAALDDALGAAPDTYSGVAAVTASVDGSTRADAPVHVFVNPDVMGSLDGQGAQIVLSHEATHAATGAALDGRRPIWLTEGFADYVALRDVRLPLATTAGQILAQVRDGGPPAHLPDAGDFDSHSSRFGAEYEAAWLACRLVADRAGERALVALYDRVGAGEDLDAVLRDLLGVGTRGLTRLWQDRLSHWAA